MSKRHKPEEIVAKLRQVDVLTSQGQSVADAVRSIGVTEVTYYRWRQEYGGLKSDQVRRMKALELENQRLRKAVADLTLDKLILAEAARGNFQAPHADAPVLSIGSSSWTSPSAAPARRSASIARHEPQGTAGQRRRGGADRRHHRLGAGVWPLRLPQDHGSPARRGLGGERQARRADLARGRAQGASQAAQERATVAGRRCLASGSDRSGRTTSGPTTSSRIGRMMGASSACSMSWTSSRMNAWPSGWPASSRPRTSSMSSRTSSCLARRAQPHPLRQWARVRRPRCAGLDQNRGRQDRPHRPKLTMGWRRIRKQSGGLLSRRRATSRASMPGSEMSC